LLLVLRKFIYFFENKYDEKNNEENGDIIDKSMTHQHFLTKNEEKDLFVHGFFFFKKPKWNINKCEWFN